MSFPASAALSTPWLPGRTMLRYGVSVAGPVAVSGAHFLASLIFLNSLPADHFGLFSFVMVAVSFMMSANGALTGVPLTLAGAGREVRPACFVANAPFCLAVAALLLVALRYNGASFSTAAALSLYGAVFTFRCFARYLAYVEGDIARALGSDVLYGGMLVAGLGALKLSGHFSFAHGAEILLAASLIALMPFGRDFFHEMTRALRRRALEDYARLFRQHTRWSLMGVALTEVTANAHAYLVTFISGPGAFALLALGALLMRPAALAQTALPDLERPGMARAIARGDARALRQILRTFTGGLSAVWLGNVLLCAGLLAFAPDILPQKDYALGEVALVAGIAAVIMAVRALRTAPAVLLQAAGEFKALARVSMESAILSVGATLALLLLWGPAASLGGILLGDLVILGRTHYLARRWHAVHV
jgi:hypothetical protein